MSRLGLVRALLASALTASVAAAGGGVAAQGTQGTPHDALVWPAGQAFPTFAKATALDVADISSEPLDVKIALTTLQGLVNRERSRIYFLRNDGEGKRTWLDALDLPTHDVADPMTLFSTYRDAFKGIVVDDPDVPASVNVATTLAGLDDAVVADPPLAARLTATYHVPVVEDLRGRFHDALDAYTWAFEHLWARTTHRIVVGSSPSEASLRDYPVATRALVVQLGVGVAEERALFDRILRAMPPNSPYLGWFARKDPASGEIPGVIFLSQHGDYDVAGPIFANATAFGGVPAPDLANEQPPSGATPALQNRIYVTFTMSDGDNPQYVQHRMRSAWNDPARGRVPINWTVQPLLADLAPQMLAYYKQTATPDDLLVAGPSGAGYAFVTMFPPEAFRAFAAQTGRYFARTGIRIAEVHNWGGRGRGQEELPPDAAAAYRDRARPLGAFVFVQGRRPGALLDGGAVPAAVQLNVEHLADGQTKLATWKAAWDGRAPAFLAVYLNAWGMGPSDAAMLAASLGPDCTVVRGDQFFALAAQAHAF